MKISGIIKTTGKNVEMRACAESNWQKIFQTSDKCLASEKVPSFKFTLAGKAVPLKDGMICICDSDKCNPAAKPRPIFAITALVSLAGLGLVYFKY